MFFFIKGSSNRQPFNSEFVVVFFFFFSPRGDSPSLIATFQFWSAAVPGIDSRSLSCVTLPCLLVCVSISLESFQHGCSWKNSLWWPCYLNFSYKRFVAAGSRLRCGSQHRCDLFILVLDETPVVMENTIPFILDLHTWEFSWVGLELVANPG